MRKVKFNVIVPAEYVDNGLGRKVLKEGTGGFQKDYPNEGVFHQWAYCGDGGGGTNTIGLIELPDGTMKEIPPTNVKFIS